MISYDVEASRPERAKDSFVHRRAIHAEVSEVVIVEHQGREIDASRGELGRNGIFERSGERDDRRGLNAIASKIVFAFGEGNRGWSRRACRRCCWRCTGALLGCCCLRALPQAGCPVGIARPALAINLARGADRTGE